jgi:hypothetical protein
MADQSDPTKRERSPAPEYTSDLLGTALLASMGKVTEQHKRIREFVVMHLAVNGHSIRIPADQYMSRRYRGYTLGMELADDGAVEVFAQDPKGNRVGPHTTSQPEA